MLLKQAHGLSTEEAIYRQDLLGPNFIPVHVPNFFMALIQEYVSVGRLCDFGVDLTLMAN